MRMMTGFGGRRFLLTVMVVCVVFAGCVKAENAETTEQGEAASAGTPGGGDGTLWLSAGCMDEYGGILKDYAKENYTVGNILEINAGARAEISDGILCDFDGDGISPELLYLVLDDDGYDLKLYYLANDGYMTVECVTISESSGGEPQGIVCNYCRTDDRWDIIVECEKGSSDYCMFFEYDGKELAGRGEISGKLSCIQNDDGSVCCDDNGRYEFTSDYTDSCRKIQYYEFDADTGAFEQKIPEYVSSLKDVKGFWELSGLDVVTTKTAWQLNFSKTFTFDSDTFQTGLLEIGSGTYYRTESTSGQVGWVEVKGGS